MRPELTAPQPEQARVGQSSPRHPGDWKAIGPWLSERAWGTVREDYSSNGDAWRYFPHDHARSRAYRWSEDGLAGLCDIDQRMCFALAFWNGRDPILKERIYGLSGPEGNHGEDAKEHWWYEDATPTSSWLRWRYHYPQDEFPYSRLREENARRGRSDREFELADTGIFDESRYWADHSRVCKGIALGCLRPPAHPQCRPRSRGPARPADALVPQPMVVGRRGPASRSACCIVTIDGCSPRNRRGSECRSLGAGCGRGRERRDARVAVLRERNQRGTALRGSGDHAVSQGRHQRPRAQRCGDSKSAARTARRWRAGIACGSLPATRSSCAFASRGRTRTMPRISVRRSIECSPSASGSGRVLCGAPAGRRDRRRGAGDAPGVRRHGLEPAVLSLRRRSAGSRATA